MKRASRMRDPRSELFAMLGENDDRFPNMVYFYPVPNRQEIDYVSVHIDADWPSDRNGPVLFKDIEKKYEKIPIFNIIYSIKSFLERSLISELKIIEIRTGCVKVVFTLESLVPSSSVIAGLDNLLANKQRYRAFEASARVGKRRVY
ncbi:hypothetical protein [Fulvimarina sp. MAC8]|uniref:hypothetical protein n=1 Tax=Fulvimarina sp. MAC8 TaxID=3162874 RepID=UPI0032EFA3E6